MGGSVLHITSHTITHDHHHFPDATTTVPIVTRFEAEQRSREWDEDELRAAIEASRREYEDLQRRLAEQVLMSFLCCISLLAFAYLFK